MNLTGHFVKKDFHRLRRPLALFSLLVIGKIIFYAVIGGLFAAPDIEWLRRMQNGPEMLLRTLAEPIMAYVLVGWLVFEDSPVEKDAHWLTRPISGAQMLGAKLLAAFLMFVLWPLLLNGIWWAAGGAGAAEIARSSAEFVVTNGAFVGMGLACAALTGGFPRYILWTLVGVVVFCMLQLAFTLIGGAGAGLVRFTASLVGGGIFGLVVAGHQFVTRRRRRSLALVGAGLVLVVIAGSALRGNAPRNSSRPAPPEVAAAIKLQLTGPARYRVAARQHHVVLPVRVSGVPEKSALAGLRIRGNWSLEGKKAWTSQAGLSRPSLWDEAIRRQLGLSAPAEGDGQFTINLPFSASMAQRVAQKPAALDAEVDLELGQGAVLAELPLREGRAGAYAVSFVSSGPNPEKGTSNVPSPPGRQGVSLLLTEFSARGLEENSSTRTIATHYALVNRQTGEVLLPDNPRSGPEAVSILNQAKIACWRLTYLTGTEPLKLDDLRLVVLRFDRRETVHLTMHADPVAFAGEPVPGTAAFVARPAPSVPSPPERRAMDVPPDLLAAFAGSYELRPDFVLTVTLENGGLVIDVPGQGRRPVLAETETRFYSPAVADAHVEFVRDVSGAVTHLVVHANGRDQRAARRP